VEFRIARRGDSKFSAWNSNQLGGEFNSLHPVEIRMHRMKFKLSGSCEIQNSRGGEGFKNLYEIGHYNLIGIEPKTVRQTALRQVDIVIQQCKLPQIAEYFLSLPCFLIELMASIFGRYYKIFLQNSK
jgi:hypothetical protein